MIICLFATTQRPTAITIIRQTVRWLQEAGCTVRLPTTLAHASGVAECAVDEAVLVDGCNVAIAIGGDGTMLGAVRSCAPAQVPVLGVNAGALGFLTEVTPDELPGHLPRVLNSEYGVESRMMLHAGIYRGSTLLAEALALNDIVVRQGAKGRLIHLRVMVAGHHLGRFSADGLIFSTPTGSTAYGLSAGGPIVHPLTSVITLVPIAAHSLSLRPMVIPATDPIKVYCDSNQHADDMLVIADGLEPVDILPGDHVVIQPAAEHALLVKFGHFSYYDRLREKLGWAGG